MSPRTPFAGSVPVAVPQGGPASRSADGGGDEAVVSGRDGTDAATDAATGGLEDTDRAASDASDATARRGLDSNGTRRAEAGARGPRRTVPDLDLRRHAKRLGPLGARLAASAPLDLWETDTRLLPRALRRYRRKLRDFAQAELAPRAAAADADPHGFDPRPLLTAAARAGLLSDLLPRPLGTGPLRHWGAPLVLPQALKAEELFAADAGLGLVITAHQLGLAPLMVSGDLGAWRRWLLPVQRANARGRPTLAAFAITEPEAGSDVEDTEGAATARLGTRAHRIDGGWRIRGRKVFISGGDLADLVTVFAALEDEGIDSWTCFVVERGTPGFEVVRTEDKMGQRASGAAELLFDDVEVSDAHVVGPLRGGWAINKGTLNLSRVAVGAIGLGIARGALETTLEAARTPRGGRPPLLAHPEIRLQLADMVMQVTALRALVWHAARWTRPRALPAAAAKALGGDLAYGVCRKALEILGDEGVAARAGVERRLRDARLVQIYEGTNQINRLAVVEALLEDEPATNARTQE